MISGTGKPPSPPIVVDKTLSSTSNILKLLPTGTMMAFHVLAPSFSSHGAGAASCGTAGRLLTMALVASCLLLSFTDSLVDHGDGRLYYGVATRRGFYPFNFEGTREEREDKFGDLPRMKLKALDFVHALISSVIFIAVAVGNANIQSCLFSADASASVRAVFMNLLVELGLLSSTVFMIFPTTRKSIALLQKSSLQAVET